MNTSVGVCGGTQFWNETLLLESSWPHLTLCFQGLLLPMIPCAWFWLSLPFYLYFLCCHRHTKAVIPMNKLSVAKLCLCLCLVVVVTVDITKKLSLKTITEMPIYIVIDDALKITTFLVVCVITQLERVGGMVTSAVLFVFWLLLFVCNIVPFYSKLILQSYKDDLFDFVTFQVFFFLIVVQVILSCWAEPLPTMSLYKENQKVCPEMESSILNRIYFWWMNSILTTCHKKTLEEEDLWVLHEKDRSSTLVPYFENTWEEEVSKCQQKIIDREEKKKSAHQFLTGEGISEKTPLISSLTIPSPPSTTHSHRADRKDHQPSLIMTLAKSYGAIYIVSLVWKFLSDVLQFVSPVLLGVLITYADNRETQSLWIGYLSAIGLFIAALVQSIFYHQNFHLGMTVGMRIRCSLIGAIYKKALKFSPQTDKGFTLRDIVSLMSIDCQRVQDMFAFAWSLMTCPLQLAIGIYLLWRNVGISCLAGLGILVLLVPLNSFMVSKQKRLQTQILFLKGNRIKLMNEILNGMKVLKMHTWEPSYQRQVNDIRDQELGVLRKVAYLQGCSTVFWTLTPFLVTLATFVLYLMTSEEHYLNPQKAFVSIAIFNILRLPINLMAQTISLIIQARLSLRRIQSFLSVKDIDEENVKLSFSSDYAIEVDQGYFAWQQDTTPPTLRDINLKVSDGQLVAVVGQSGSGKSSIISALLGEIHKTGGRVNVKGSKAYVPKDAWIQNATLMGNILFGKPFLQKKYKKVIEACAFTTADLDRLPGRDLTNIGEKDINLSEEQKQRVSLARSVYSNSDVYLMDEPLSAVDSRIGKRIFDKVIGPKGLLKNKTRILVTHGVQWLPIADVVIVMDNGKIAEMGPYAQLVTHNGPFTQFLQQYFIQEDESEADEDQDILIMKERILDDIESLTSEVLTSDTDSHSVRQTFRKRKSRATKRDQSQPNKSPDQPKPHEELPSEEILRDKEIKCSVLWDYISSMGVCATIFILLSFTGYHASSVFANFWLTYWTEDSFLSNSSNVPNTTYYQERSYQYLLIYGLLGVSQAIFVLIYSLFICIRMVLASRNLHTDMLSQLFRAPMEFFDTTPLRRIITRFASDVNVLDNTLPLMCRITLNSLYVIVSILIVISIGTPVVLSVVVPVVAVYCITMKFYIPTIQQLKRMESMTRSSLFNKFSETVTGASVIRAYRVVERFLEESMMKLDMNLVYCYASFSLSRWLGVRIEFLGNCLVLATALFSVFSDLNGASVGLSLTYVLQATTIMNLFAVNLSDFVDNIISVKRIREYANIKKEAEWYHVKRPPKDWPKEGSIQFVEYKTKYREGLDFALRGINVDINHNEKIGIIGHPGSGKSSLVLSLFRLIEATGGNITIDGVVLSSVGLHDLRSKITILPQEPVLFSGSLRMNLDPYDLYSDDRLWSALESVQLKTIVLTLPTQLDYQCGEGGTNLSVGQRQRVCLARAILRKTNILILEESPGVFDYQTEDVIQQTIKKEFQDCTVLCIALKPSTVLQHDRILVLKNGLVAEFDTPVALLADNRSIFHGMAKEAGLTIPPSADLVAESPNGHLDRPTAESPESTISNMSHPDPQSNQEGTPVDQLNISGISATGDSLTEEAEGEPGPSSST